MVYPQARSARPRPSARGAHRSPSPRPRRRSRSRRSLASSGIDHVLCTEVEVVDGLATGQARGPGALGPRARRGAVRAFADAEGSRPRGELRLRQRRRRTSPTSRRSAGPARSTPTVGSRRSRASAGWTTYRLPAAAAGPVRCRSRARAPRWPASRARSRPASGWACSTAAGGSPRTWPSAPARTSAWRSPGSSLDVRGEEHLWSERPAVFIFNHQSSLDMLIVGSLVRAGHHRAWPRRRSRAIPASRPIGLAHRRRLRRPRQHRPRRARRWRRSSTGSARDVARDRAGGHAHAHAAAGALQEGRVPHRDAGQRTDRADRAAQRG